MTLDELRPLAEACRKNAMALRAFGEDFGHGSESAALDQAAAYIEAAAKREADHERAIAEAVKPWRELVERMEPMLRVGSVALREEMDDARCDARALLEKKP